MLAAIPNQFPCGVWIGRLESGQLGQRWRCVLCHGSTASETFLLSGLVTGVMMGSYFFFSDQVKVVDPTVRTVFQKAFPGELLERTVTDELHIQNN